MIDSLKYRQLIPFFILFFFFNGIFLPQGLLFTTILSPVMLYSLYRSSEIKKLFLWSLVLILPIPFQIAAGVDIKSFIVSYTLIFTVWIFLFFANKYLKLANKVLPQIFNSLLKINFWLLLLSLILLLIPLTRDFAWDLKPISPSVPSIARLQMFAYEPSHYAILMMPIFLYFILKIFIGKSNNPLLTALAVFIPLLLTISFGVIGAFVISIIFIVAIYFKKLPAISRSYAFYLLLFVVILSLLLLYLWPENPIYARIKNIFDGKDTSANGRLSDSFMFAKDLIFAKSVAFGIGPGQVKILAHDMIINFYKYDGQIAQTVRIPNSMAEMLASFGVYGFITKIFFEIYFFIKLKLWNNIYSLALFIFIFIYQFTGSFLTSVAEIGVWMFVFSAHFPEFNVEYLNSNAND